VRDKLAEHPSSFRQLADRLSGLLVDTGGDEPLELYPRRVGHSERRVPRSRQLPGRLHQPPQDDLDIELGQNLARETHSFERVGTISWFAFT